MTPQLFQMIAQKRALELEIKGMRHSRGSVYGLLKRIHGFKGNKEKVLEQFSNLIEKEKENEIRAMRS